MTFFKKNIIEKIKFKIYKNVEKVFMMISTKFIGCEQYEILENGSVTTNFAIFTNHHPLPTVPI